MAFPDHFDASRIGRLFVPDVSGAVEAGRAAGFPPAGDDEARILLLLVDVQVDFVHLDGALSVPGAADDTRRTIEWIFAHAHRLHGIAASLDSHRPLQIFFRSWWADEGGRHPEPFTTVTARDVEAGRWQPLHEAEWSRRYVATLERKSRKELMIWPYHTLIGTPGHALVPSLYEAVAFHAAARGTDPTFLAKGSIPRTEHYSILEPEVKVPDEPGGRLDTGFLQMLAEHDLVYVAGQAKSHCVLETLASMVRAFGDRPDVLRKLRVLTDCTSSVAHPSIDFDALANEAFAGFEQRGVRLVRSTDPLG
jgi:nicotinamidase-related amidase